MTADLITDKVDLLLISKTKIDDTFSYMLLLYHKHANIYIFTIRQLRYSREEVQFFAYIPGA